MNSQNSNSPELSSAITKNKLDQQVVSHRVRLASGIPLSFFFISVVILGWIFEIVLSKLEQQKITVSIEAISRDVDEVEKNNKQKQFISEEHQKLAIALYQLTVDDSVDLSNFDILPIINHLPSDDKNIVFTLVIKRLTKEGNFELVSDILSNFTVEKRLRLDVQFSMAFSQSKLGKNVDAIESYQALLSDNDSNQSVIINLGTLYLRERQYTKAQQHFLTSIDKVSGIKKAKVFSGLAEAQKNTNQLEQSIKSYQKSIEYRPSYAPSWRHLANLSALVFTDHPVTLQRFDKAIALDKNNTEIYLEFAKYLIKKMDYILAIQELKKAKKLSRNRFDIRYLLIVCYSFENKSINASKQLKLAINIAKRSRDILVVNALADYLAADYRSSINLFKGLLKKNRDNSIEYYLIAQSYIAINKDKSANIYLNKISEKSYLYYPSQTMQARILFRQKSYRTSLNIYELLLTKITDEASLFFDASFPAEKLSELEKSIGLMKNALNHGDRPSYQLRLIELLWRSGSRADAFDLLDRLISDKPHYLKAKYRLASYLYQNGQIDRAISAYLLLSSHKADYGDVQYQLAKLYYEQRELETSLLYIKAYLDDNIDAKTARLLNARVFCEMGQSANCLDALQLLLKLDPNFQPAIKFAESLEKH